MKIWILRHGEAEPHARRDAERELTAHGREQVLHSAALLIGQPLDSILVSPYVRAQQTAELVRKALGFTSGLITVPWLTPESEPKFAVSKLPDSGNVLLVSHQPFVGELISLLVHGHVRQPQPMQTASLVELEGEWPLAGSMTLLGVHHP
ncbi:MULTISPECIES: phosphohistidine phosphatase SixA [Pseudomonas]|jgi:phosphohistidine phosphatase|uniref:phosphohistidine phosphatase SixA n=1 Tax=Pseudomonas TaxID=286 RepID=UPI0003578E24|nr:MULTISPECIES: phosphohistidine phosphatase SixA [Pseudomonas]EPJ91449.1 phosphohistidine phosphatase SixA [Pseudomonas psychrophila]KOX62476.1 phosphohistidine phosphatase [Pseudomonas psychrophila]MDY7581520.1 phosphohistidine phosphatase SixA [Pseudomonas sp. CCI3.1]MEB0068886.1 phosphohistidine phosphatase SixA [Pseudomonas sp. CCI3.1]MEB0074674.1 phosphohistidine phosphatase SixA [Pseudomonas sp. CCI1.4]